MISKFQTKQHLTIVITFIAAFIFLALAYYPSLNAPQFSTDDSILINIPQIKKAFALESIKTVFTPANNPDYYPIRDLSYMIDQYFWNSDPFIARVHQLILFTISSIFLFLIFTELKISTIPALSMAIIWLIHPYHAETVLWLSARKDVLAILFALITTYLALLGFNKKRVILIWISIAFFILSLLSKASFTLLPLIFLTGICFKIIKIEDKKFYYPLIAGLFLCLISTFGQSWYYSVVNNMQRSIPFMDRLFLSVTALGRMTTGWILPKVNAVDLENHGDWLSLNFRFFYVGLVVWIMALSVLLLAILRKNTFVICILFTFAFLYIPVSGIVFSHNIFFSTRYFEPVALFSILLIALFLNKKNSRNILFIAPIVLITLGFFTINEGKSWKSNVAIREKALSVNPENINLQSILFFDIINTQATSSDEDLKQKKISLINSLEEHCGLQKPLDENCKNFYNQAYYINRWNKNYEVSRKYLNNFLNLLEKITPRPRAYDRLQVEQMLLDGSLNNLSLEKFNFDSQSALVSSDYRFLFLISGCLLNKPVYKIKESFIKKNLIIESEFIGYISENIHPTLQARVNNCFK